MHSQFCRHKWQHLLSLSISHFYPKVHIHPKKQEKHIQAPHRKGTSAMPDIQDYLLSTTHVKLSYGLLVISSRSPVIYSNTQGPCERVPIMLKRGI